MTGRMPLYKKIDQWCIPRYNALICVSEDLRDECARLRIPESKVHLIHNGIDEQVYQRTLETSQAKEMVGARKDRFLLDVYPVCRPKRGFSN